MLQSCDDWMRARGNHKSDGKQNVINWAIAEMLKDGTRSTYEIADTFNISIDEIESIQRQHIQNKSSLKRHIESDNSDICVKLKVSKEDHSKALEVCNKLGISMAEYLEMCISLLVQENGLPFNAKQNNIDIEK